MKHALTLLLAPLLVFGCASVGMMGRPPGNWLLFELSADAEVLHMHALSATLWAAWERSAAIEQERTRAFNATHSGDYAEAVNLLAQAKVSDKYGRHAEAEELRRKAAALLASAAPR